MPHSENATEAHTNAESIKAKLQEAFDNEDWLTYTILVDQMDGVDKNLKMVCQIITSDFTNEQEKTDAIQYIKDNHDKLMQSELLT